MREVVLVHTSDVHVDDADGDGYHSGTPGLRAVLRAAGEVDADVVLLAGDTFDNPRVKLPALQAAAELLAGAGRPVVMLPGNHDPLLENCIFRRSGIADIPHVQVFGIDAAEVFRFEALGLEISGKPHVSFENMAPFHPPRARAARFHVVMAHGHYVAPEDWAEQAHRSWLISDAALAETGADYVALGHWDRPTPAGDGAVRAYYSGSPKLAKTANVVRLGASITVERHPLRWD